MKALLDSRVSLDGPLCNRSQKCCFLFGVGNCGDRAGAFTSSGVWPAPLGGDRFVDASLGFIGCNGKNFFDVIGNSSSPCLCVAYPLYDTIGSDLMNSCGFFMTLFAFL